MHLPVGLMRAGATLTDWLPFAPITRDQLKMLVEGGDQVCDPSPAIEALRRTPDRARRAAPPRWPERRCSSLALATSLRTWAEPGFARREPEKSP